MQIAQSASVWKERIVVTAALVPADLITAFLAAGAAAVICRSPNTTGSATPLELAHFFRDLYTALFEEGYSASDALNTAGKIQCTSIA